METGTKELRVQKGSEPIQTVCLCPILHSCTILPSRLNQIRPNPTQSGLKNLENSPDTPLCGRGAPVSDPARSALVVPKSSHCPREFRPHSNQIKPKSGLIGPNRANDHRGIPFEVKSSKKTESLPPYEGELSIEFTSRLGCGSIYDVAGSRPKWESNCI